MENIEIRGKGELFPLWLGRILITAVSPEWALTAARAASGFGYKKGVEGGIDLRVLDGPDGRPGVILMIAAPTKAVLEKEMARRMTQSILPTPTACCLNAMEPDPEVENVKIGDSIALFGDGLQKKARFQDRQVWLLPSFDDPNGFILDSEFGLKRGVSTSIVLSGDPTTMLKAGMMFAEIIQETPGVICPYPGGLSKFGVKIGSVQYDFMKDKGTINQAFCPGIESSTINENEIAYQIIIDSLDVVKLFDAIKKGIEGIQHVPGLTRVTAVSHEGKLGEEFDLSQIF
ncbi:MAG: hypothetical protein ACTSRW_14560 [Candidatus Helarchaeota archaeon]